MMDMNATNWAESVVRHLSEHGVETGVWKGRKLPIRVPTSEGPVEAVVEAFSRDGAVARPSESLVPTIVAQRHIPPGLGQRYRSAGVPYIDSGGNSWMAFPGYTVHVQGNPSAYRPAAGRDRPSRAFRPAGLRVVFALLSRPELLLGTVREIASASTVSVGATQMALRDLASEGYLHEAQGGGRFLSKRGTLATRWVSAYVSDLRPRLPEVALVGPPPQWWVGERGGDAAGEGQVGGEAALQALGYGARALTTTVYGEEPWHGLRRSGRLARGETANVTLRQRFWAAGEASGLLVPRLLIYADAIATDEPRQVEMALQMRNDDEELRRLFDGG